MDFFFELRHCLMKDAIEMDVRWITGGIDQRFDKDPPIELVAAAISRCWTCFLIHRKLGRPAAFFLFRPDDQLLLTLGLD